MPSDHIPIVLSQFNGIWDRGEDDLTPKDHLPDGLNFDWDGDIIKTRDGSSKDITISAVKRFFEYRRLGEASRYLILDDNGDIYDSTSLGSPILSIATMTDFSLLVFNNRAYITPHDRAQGLSGESVYVYNGSGTARAAAGSAPAGTLTVADSATSGFVSAGTHLFAVAYETDSGFITKPGPAIYAEFSTAGGFAVDFSTIPTGPAGTSKRHLLATKLIPVYDGNQDGYEFFFIPGAVIDDNVTTVLAAIDFFDADLFKSAEYLFDQLETISAGLGLEEYRGRMVQWGEDGNENVVRVSKKNEPESFDALSGFMIVDPSKSEGIRNCVSYRDSLYMTKPDRLYQAVDNGDEPGTWPWITIDDAHGAEVFSVGRVLDSKGANVKSFLLADRSGLHSFVGVTEHPELTWKIDGLWKRINKAEFDQVQVHVDPTSHKLYVAVPLDAATEPSHIFVGDFERGLDPQNIRWSIWTFPVDPTSILVRTNSTTNAAEFCYASSTGNTYIQDSSTNDEAVAIPTPFIETYLASIQEQGQVHHLGNIHLRVKGSGNLDLNVKGLDDLADTDLDPIVMSSAPQREYLRIANFVNEKISLKLRTTAIDENFRIIKITLWIKVIWSNPVTVT